MVRYFIIIIEFSAFTLASQLCLAEKIPFERLVHGANLSRNQIKTAELRFLISQEFPESPEDIEKRIQDRIHENKEILKRLKTEGEEEVQRFLKIIRRSSGARYYFDGLNVAFQRFDDDPIGAPEIYQYKLTKIDRREIDDLYDEAEGAIRYGGHFQMNSYDGKIQAYEYLEAGVSESVSFSMRDKYAGFSYYYFFGRPQYRILPNAKFVGRATVGTADCYILEYRVKEKKVPSDLLIKVWINPQKQFCIRKEIIEQTFAGNENIATWEMLYDDFRRYGEIWFPHTIRKKHEKNGKIVYIDDIIVKDAQFNPNFPANFFQVDPQVYIDRGSRITPGSEIRTSNFERSPAHKLPEEMTESQAAPDLLLLTCGPNSLLRVCELLRVKAEFDELSQLSRFDPTQGTTLLGLRDAAKYKGLNPKGIKTNLRSLKKNKLPMPAIAYVKGNHFLVFEEVVSDGVRISDSANKYDHHLTFKELSEIWSGELLIFDYQPEQIKQEPIPLALVEAGFYDFGEALGGDEVRHTFKLKNIGQKPLKITKVDESCACTATLISKDEIPPGAFGIIEAVLKVPSENRQVEESINVYTNDPTQNRVTLIFKGTAYVPITTFPPRLLIGSVQSKTGVTKSLTIHRKSNTQILGVRTDSSHLRTTIVSAKADPIMRIEVALLESAPVGQFVQNILVDYRYEGKKTTHKVMIFGEILGAFAVSPNQFFFGLVKDKQAVSKTVAISSVDKHSFKIVSVESNLAYVTTKISPRSDGIGFQLTATVQSEAPAGPLSSEILVKTDSTVQPMIQIPFSGIISN